MFWGKDGVRYGERVRELERDIMEMEREKDRTGKGLGGPTKEGWRDRVK